jgi:hypothetical protein
MKCTDIDCDMLAGRLLGLLAGGIHSPHDRRVNLSSARPAAHRSKAHMRGRRRVPETHPQARQLHQCQRTRACTGTGSRCGLKLLPKQPRVSVADG